MKVRVSLDNQEVDADIGPMTTGTIYRQGSTRVVNLVTQLVDARDYLDKTHNISHGIVIPDNTTRDEVRDAIQIYTGWYPSDKVWTAYGNSQPCYVVIERIG